tara:strand:- start:39 stop:395 length:357 start_codon:yes stop_codon:yes gene_type:complete
MKTEMTFAPGWTQTIDRENVEQERTDLVCYISDTYKALNGVRPHGWDLREWSLDDLRREADDLEVEIHETIKWEREQAAERAHNKMLDANKHALATRRAKKPLPRTYKPFNMLQELLV